MKLTWNNEKYVIELDQSELDFVLDSLMLSTTHVSDAEYDIVTGRPKGAGEHVVFDLADQSYLVYEDRVRAELEDSGAISVVLRAMGDLPALDDDQIAAKVIEESSKRGRALEQGDRPQVILLQRKIDAQIRELIGRGSDVPVILRGMLYHDDPGVQLTAATYLFEADPSAAARTLEALAVTGQARIAYRARLILKEWRVSGGVRP